MELKIINKTGFGRHTKIIVMDKDEEIGQLSCVRSINFDCIDAEKHIVANLRCYIKNIKLLARPKKETLSILHYRIIESKIFITGTKWNAWVWGELIK